MFADDNKLVKINKKSDGYHLFYTKIHFLVRFLKKTLAKKSTIGYNVTNR